MADFCKIYCLQLFQLAPGGGTIMKSFDSPPPLLLMRCNHRGERRAAHNKGHSYQSGYSECFGSSCVSRYHGARDSQKMLQSGSAPGSSSSDPAGTSTRDPSPISRGTGEPQVVQKQVAKRSASGRSYLTVASSPESHRSCAGDTKIFAACAVPVALRQRRQWQYRNT